MRTYILLLFLGITLTVNAQICLEVPLIIKEQTNWCGIASSKCVLAYYGYSSIRQCEIAEYVRNNCPYGDYGSTNCCLTALWGCNEPLYLSCLQDILVHFGNITNAPADNPLILDGIEWHLNQQRPIIMRWENLSNPAHGHAMVIYGIDSDRDTISVMDPDPWPDGGFKDFSYNDLLNDGTFRWAQTITLLVSPYIIPSHCTNCILDSDEEDIDCGGSCPPCRYAPDRISYETPDSNLPSDVRAVAEITAGNADVKVLSGQNVNFYTAGTIDLMPGFEVELGANFNTQILNTVDLQQVCGKFCDEDRYGPITAYRYQDIFTGFHIVNVDRIEYEIYNVQSGRLIYDNVVHINDYGEVALWDLITGESSYPTSVTYYVAHICVYPCMGGSQDCGTVRFTVFDLDKSLSDDIEETDTPAPYFSSPSNTITLQNENINPNFFIIPNPNPGAFQLEPNFPLSEIGNLRIVNLLGTSVYETQNITSNTFQLQNVPVGQYFVIMMLKDGTILTQKMMLQR